MCPRACHARAGPHASPTTRTARSELTVNDTAHDRRVMPHLREPDVNGDPSSTVRNPGSDRHAPLGRPLNATRDHERPALARQTVLERVPFDVTGRAADIDAVVQVHNPLLARPRA